MFFSGAKKTLAQAFREGNSKNRFVNELKANEDKIFNSSFDSAYSCLSKRRHLKQTQICVRRSLKRPSSDSFTTVDKLETKTELFLMPMPKKTNDPKIKLNTTSTAEGGKPYPHSETNDDFKTNNVMNNVQRNMRAFVGNVDFVVNTLKLYPTINALWDVYGKLIKMTKGKHRYEHFILVRNIDGGGPILQCSYFDFDHNLENLTVGSNIRIVGKSNGRFLRIFRIETYQSQVAKSNFIRIQNVNSFVLLQNQNTA